MWTDAVVSYFRSLIEFWNYEQTLFTSVFLEYGESFLVSEIEFQVASHKLGATIARPPQQENPWLTQEMSRRQ